MQVVCNQVQISSRRPSKCKIKNNTTSIEHKRQVNMIFLWIWVHARLSQLAHLEFIASL